MEINSNQSALWTKLEGFNINDGDETFTFEHRLARENGWTIPFAYRVVEEYRKFVFLCATAGHPCTPSEEVDEAWHLHMIYTKSYWERMVPLLPFPLHHRPTKGGGEEDAKFVDWYQRTLESYEKIFGQAPPADIWPPANQRFLAPPCGLPTYDPAHSLLIRRRTVERVGMAAAALTSFFVLSGFIHMVAEVSTSKAAVAAGVLVGLGALIVYAIRNAQQGGSGYGTGSGCSAGIIGCGATGADASGGAESGGGGGCGSSGCGGGGCGGGCGGGGCGS